MNKEELEKEAEGHSKNYPFIICMHNGRVRKSGKQIAIENYLAGAEPREKRIADLEKKVGMYQIGMFDEIEKRDKKLSKATEIIRGLYFIIQGRIDYENNTGIADEMWRAEQFLKE